jgi:preprotein translocase subunit SecY
MQSVMSRVRDFPKRWRGTLSVATIAALCELGARIGLPGVDAKVVEQFLRGDHAGLIWLYNFLAGGGLSRAALLAVGVVPYLAARLWLWLGRSLSSDLRRATDDQRTRTRAERGLTAALAAVQSLGYVNLVTSIPNAVAAPGPIFVVRSVLLLTGSAVVAGLLAEQLSRRPSASPPVVTPELPEPAPVFTGGAKKEAVAS